ncbi:helix-turn-helix domain-containing protein [Streptomyces sp. NPDC001523]|uniref:helix-turn-helix domain-containing protein n=1 Tax=Streptomyces sp. NPDC001523 TaxID=3154383 RepID=UPI003319BD6E
MRSIAGHPRTLIPSRSAGSTGCSYGSVHRICTETGVTLLGRGGATCPRLGA